MAWSPCDLDVLKKRVANLLLQSYKRRFEIIRHIVFLSFFFNIIIMICRRIADAFFSVTLCRKNCA